MSDGAVRRPRMETLDVLRGLAVLGILVVNAPFFAMPWPWTVQIDSHPPVGALDTAAWGLGQVFFDGKFISMFSLLFGVSIFLVGGERADKPAGSRLRRRLFWLLAIGLIHGVAIWYGDILVSYALAGFVVLLARSWPPRQLIVTGLVILGLFGLLSLLGVLAVLVLPAEAAQSQTDLFRGVEAAALAPDGGYPGGFAASLRANARDWSTLLVFVTLPSLFLVAPLMLIGLGSFKTGVFTGEASPRVYGRLVAAGSTFLAILAALTLWQVSTGHASPAREVVDAVNGVFAPLVTLAYIGLIVPRLARGGLGWLARLLAPVGRMAFTNYLTQSLIMTALFYGGRGPGLFAEVERAGLLAIVAGVWGLQIVWSRWWLSRFAYGPFEWLWRSLTEGRAVPMRGAAYAA